MVSPSGDHDGLVALADESPVRKTSELPVVLIVATSTLPAEARLAWRILAWRIHGRRAAFVVFLVHNTFLSQRLRCRITGAEGTNLSRR